MEIIGQVVVGVLQQGNKFLVGLRPEGKPYSGVLECPGGKVEQGETPKEALKREFQEETNILINVGELICTEVVHFNDFPNGDWEILTFKVEYESGTINANVHTWLNFLTIEEIDMHKSVFSMPKLLKMLPRYING